MTVFVAFAVASPAASSAVAREPAAVRSSQELAVLLTPHEIFAAPNVRRADSSPILASRPITGVETVLPVVGHARSADGFSWLRVMVPGRPNGGRGWIKQRGTMFKRTVWHILVRSSKRRVLVTAEAASQHPSL